MWLSGLLFEWPFCLAIFPHVWLRSLDVLSSSKAIGVYRVYGIDSMPTAISTATEFNNVCMGQNGLVTTGPGIKGEGSSQTLKVLFCVFTSLSSASEGGAISVSGFTSTVEDAQFQDCFAPTSGGAIRSKLAGMTVRRCVFQRTWSGNGGAMHIGANSNAVVVEDNKFEACYGVGRPPTLRTKTRH